MLDRYELLSSSISSMYHDIQKIERVEMAKFGLKGPHAQCMLAMSRYAGGITASQLCEICDKDKAAVSRAVGEMEEKGLLMRESTGETMYRAKLKLTEEGRRAALFVCGRAQSAVAAAGRGLYEEARAAFYSSLGLIAQNLHTISKEGIPE